MVWFLVVRSALPDVCQQNVGVRASVSSYRLTRVDYHQNARAFYCQADGKIARRY
jgi:hypothetical protein